MHKMFDEAQVANAIKQSFQDWQPDTGNAEEDDALSMQRDKARNAADGCPGAPSLETLLTAIVSENQLEHALESLFARSPHRFIEHDAGLAVTARYRELGNSDQKQTLHVSVAIAVNAIRIPDPARDEMELSMRIVTGADPGALAAFMAAADMIGVEQVEDLAEKWRKPGILVGATPEEIKNLEECLGLTVGGILEERLVRCVYNYGTVSKKLWRTVDVWMRFQKGVETKNFPFDTTEVAITFETRSDYDAAELDLVPDNKCFALGDSGQSTSLDTSGTLAPCGFRFTAKEPHLVPAVRSPSSDRYPTSVLLAGVTLARRAEGIVLRTVVPTLLVALMTLAATFFAFANGDGADTVATNVLPAVLIFAAAMQLSAAQMIPANSGRTAIDKIFLGTYGVLLLEFLALQADRPELFVLSGALFVIVVAYSFARAVRRRRSQDG